MEKQLLQKILSDISTIKIAVLGDFCCDAYWFIDEAMSEISVETNQATRPVRQQRYSLGGAGNVTNNLAAIGISQETDCVAIVVSEQTGKISLAVKGELIRGLDREGLKNRLKFLKI